MEERYVIGAVYNNKTHALVNQGYYNQPIKDVICEPGKPLKVFFEAGGFFVHQVVKSIPDQDDYGFWVETTTKSWRFDRIQEG